jgi:hypothetical protein
METLRRFDELVGLLDMEIPLYLRYSPGPEADAEHPSMDHESGLPMPGHSAVPLRPPGWWTLPTADWVARRVCQYLREVHEGARPWVLTGEVADFGPDNEPLVVGVQPVAWLSSEVVTEAFQRYQERMDTGRSLH